MSFTQRLWRYMIGVFVGTLLAFFFFGTRSCSSWLPNNQVRKFLGEPGLMGDKRTRCLMRCGAVDMSGLRVLLEEDAVASARRLAVVHDTVGQPARARADQRRARGEELLPHLVRVRVRVSVRVRVRVRGTPPAPGRRARTETA